MGIQVTPRRAHPLPSVSLSRVLPTLQMVQKLSDAELAALVASRESRAEAALFLRFAPRVSQRHLWHHDTAKPLRRPTISSSKSC